MEAAEIIMYAAMAALVLSAFPLMLTAYFWLLFTVAVPQGYEWGWWFDRFNVAPWPRWKRGVTAFAFFAAAVGCIIVAGRLWFAWNVAKI